MATYSSFPHPVLGNRNNVEETLELLEPRYIPLAQEVEIILPVRCDSKQLKAMVDAGDAQVVVTWDCPSTMSRGIAKTKVVARDYGWESVLHLVQEELRGLVSIDVAVIATRDLPEFKWEAQHPVYRDATFEISEGDFLGVLGGFDFEARKIYDAMDPPVGSLFAVRTSRNPEPITVDYDQDDSQIYIQISEQLATGINQLGAGNYDATKIAFVVLPVLIDTINLMSRAIEDPEQDHYQEKYWFKALLRRIKELKLDLDNAVPTAQALLSNISAKAIAELSVEEGDHQL